MASGHRPAESMHYGPASACGIKAAREVIRPELIARKPEIIAHLRAAANDAADSSGALLSDDGGLYLPWGPYLSANEVRRLQAELMKLIGEVADVEGWGLTRSSYWSSPVTKISECSNAIRSFRLQKSWR